MPASTGVGPSAPLQGAVCIGRGVIPKRRAGALPAEHPTVDLHQIYPLLLACRIVQDWQTFVNFSRTAEWRDHVDIGAAQENKCGSEALISDVEMQVGTGAGGCCTRELN